MGRQDIHLGRPLLPAELEPLGYLERKQRVIDAINALGPPNEREQPLAGDPVLRADVESWMHESGAELGHATLLRLIQRMPERCAELERIALGARTGELGVASTPEGRWLGELARRLYGPKGPRVIELGAAGELGG